MNSVFYSDAACVIHSLLYLIPAILLVGIKRAWTTELLAGGMNPNVGNCKIHYDIYKIGGFMPASTYCA